MIQSSVFDYVNVLDKAADAAWLRNEAINNNIANVSTPEYKRKDVSFEAELQQALRGSRYLSTDKKVSNLRVSEVTPRVYTDAEGFSYRLDGNNVDIETENVLLAKNQIKYNGLMGSISQEFQNMQTAMK